MKYFCCDERRRTGVQQHPTLNGIDFLEVLDRDAPVGSPRQQTLLVRCFKPPTGLTADNVRIDGGERIEPVGIEWAFPLILVPAALLNSAEQTLLGSLNELENVLVLRTTSPGDFSTYRLVLTDTSSTDIPPVDFDSLLSAIDFSFKVECATDFDCKIPRVCPPDENVPPNIDYLAKDYASFRRLMLDRLATITPEWRDRNPADAGIAIVELLAYVGDRLSYQQDAVATEAYLTTARRRISVARHARLVDYFMHDGCNARTWIQVAVDSDVVKSNDDDPPRLPAGTPVLSAIPNLPVVVEHTSEIINDAAIVFETTHDIDELFVDHNELPFYTWGNRECCLSAGATSATLRGRFPDLRAGDVLIFEEVIGPRSGSRADADPAKRVAVRLTAVEVGDENDPLRDPLNDQPITEIRWNQDDALPMPFCMSSRTDSEHDEAFIDNVSVARGNIVLADHGRTVSNEHLGIVPESKMNYAPLPASDRCERSDRIPVPVRFGPRLREWPLTHAAEFDQSQSACEVFNFGPQASLPAIQLTSQLDGQATTWTAVRDLFNSDDSAADFVVEQESNADASLRFGNRRLGVRPESRSVFSATYRVGNGVSGNIGADSLAHIAIPIPQITGIRNPIPARGGVESETVEEVRNRAPFAFRKQERAVTAADYVEVGERDPQVQRTAATFRFTGSWPTVFLTADRRGGLPVDSEFEAQLRQRLERYRMAGYDLEVDGPRFVPLEVDVHVCVAATFFRTNVKQSLLRVFSNRSFVGEVRGIFHPDNFTFGQTVYLSQLYAAAQAVEGVSSVEIKKFQRQGTPDSKPLEDGFLKLHRLEIARLDNDPNFPERGVFRLTLGGGK